MKIIITYIFLFFVPILHAQVGSIYENSLYTYSPNETGENIYNVLHPILINDDGSLLTTPYSGKLVIFRNKSYEFLFEEFPQKGYFLDKISVNDKEYFFYTNAIILKHNGKSKQLLTFEKENADCHHDIFLNNGKIYFVIGNAEYSSLKVIENEQVKEIEKLWKASMHLFKIGNQIYIHAYIDKKLHFFKFDEKLHLVRKFDDEKLLLYANSLDDFYFYKNEDSTILYRYQNGKISKIFTGDKLLKINKLTPYYIHYEDKIARLFDLSKPITEPLFEVKTPSISQVSFSPESNSFYLGSNQYIQRAFPYFKKYPRVFEDDNSASIFAFSQTENGKVWVTTYNKGFSVIDNQQVTESKDKNVRAISSFPLKNKLIVIRDDKAQVTLYHTPNDHTVLNDTITGYYSYLGSKNVFYLGTFSHGLMYKPLQDIENQKVKWKFLGKEKGYGFLNVLSISEDRFGNLWAVGGSKGVSVYNAEKQHFTNFFTKDNPQNFGGLTSLKDTYGTLWFGSGKGELIYWDGKHPTDFDPKNFKRISHPLLHSGKYISFLHQWGDWLIIGNMDRVLLFDLKTWYEKKKPLVRYINPIEISLTADTEQNTILTDNRNQSVWFATNDMLYQWDIKNWLKLPSFSVSPSVKMHLENEKRPLSPSQTIHLSPTQRSFELTVDYQSKDNMPRLIDAQLLRNETAYTIKPMTTDTKFQFQNLSVGKYTFYLTIAQQDGSFTTETYFIEIEQFMWQKWWFWLILSIPPLGGALFHLRKQRQLERQRQEISQLNLINLGKQFRPHFMLNALNSLGAEMRDKPHAERVISRMGENINIIHQYSKNNHISIPFSQEWKLTLNTIDIQREIYIKELETSILHREIIPPDYKIPMGILQMVVENALLHGIRNRSVAPYLLEINFSEDERYYFITVSDNGVGIENSKRIYDFQKNGTGINSINMLIEIINKNIHNAFSLTTTSINPADEKYPGTRVVIKMKKDIEYSNLLFSPPPLENISD